MKHSVAVLSLVLFGCATGHQARNVIALSDFLGEHRSQMQPGKPGEEPLLVYRDPHQVQWSQYHEILLEPISLWIDPNRQMSSDDQRDLQNLVDSFHATLQRKLASDYTLVDRDGPGVMRMQIAITDGRRGATQLKVASIAVPYWIGASLFWRFATGKPPFVGEASVEYKITDAGTSELLTAGADRRVGADTLISRGAVNKEYLNSWGDVKYILEYWTDDFVYRMCLLRGGAECAKP